MVSLPSWETGEGAEDGEYDAGATVEPAHLSMVSKTRTEKSKVVLGQVVDGENRKREDEDRDNAAWEG